MKERTKDIIGYLGALAMVVASGLDYLCAKQREAYMQDWIMHGQARSYLQVIDQTKGDMLNPEFEKLYGSNLYLTR